MRYTLRRRLLAGVATLPLATALVFTGTVQSAGAVSNSTTPSADSYVRDDQPTANFGTATSIQARTTPNFNAYLKFTVSGLVGRVSKATLQLYSRSTGATVVKVSKVSDTTWSQSTLTYANAPAIGAVVGSTGALTAGAWTSVDVSTAVTGNGTYSFALTAGATAARIFDSKEGQNPPQLVVDTSTDPVVVAGGDVSCAPSDPGLGGGAGTPGHCHEAATAALIGQVNPLALLVVGDAQYNSGALADYISQYGPTWGQYLGTTKPSVGNHDYGQSGASGYFHYFGDRATPLQPGCLSGCNGYYSFDIGTWHLINVNTECTRINGGAGCAAGSPQETWLKADLAAHPSQCTLVFGHRPRWSSNSFQSPEIAPLVDDMYAAGVELLVTGHAHSYERFAPQNPAGQLDNTNGIREIIAGTGGDNFSGFGTIEANSQVHKTNIFGVLKITLHPGSYDTSFVADPSTPFSDSTSGTCH